MGFPSYQEDIQDAKGEPIKTGKQKLQVIRKEEIDKRVEPDPRTEIGKNTVIVKADGIAINSIEIEGYAFDITFTDEVERLEPQIDLTATARAGSGGSGKVSLIATFYDIKEACSLLTALMSAIENQEAVFSVSQHKLMKETHG
ncbi:MAG: hypothetical protein OXC79_05480 [Candidatus Poribacteria bacterium]|nr:hypothetical protein [Candidatus Poribacteria bacterium]